MADSGGTNTSTSSTAPASAAVRGTIDKLATGLGNEFAPGKSLFQAPGATTTGGQAASLDAANNPLYSQGVNGAIGDFADIAAGNRFGTNDPGYAALRSKLSNDVLTQTNSAFNNSGLFGSDNNQKAAASGLADSLGALDYSNFQNDQQRQQQAAGLLPGLFSAAQLPSSVQQSVGASQDAAAAAKAAGPTDFLAKLTAIANGNAGAAGTTTTNTSPGTPLWQTLLGGGIGLAGLLGG
jgi:hypothetical protein